MALCAAFEIKQNNSGNCFLIARIHINGNLLSHHDACYFNPIQSVQVWPYYIPFLTLMSQLERSWLRPYMLLLPIAELVRAALKGLGMLFQSMFTIVR